jgi:hypothetical protein
MPSLPLIVRGITLTQRRGQPGEVEFPHGVLPLASPLADPPFSRVRALRVLCNYRVPPVSGVREAILDTGAMLSLFPRELWRDQFRWREGVHFDVCDFAGLGSVFDAQLLGTGYRCRIARLRVPVEVASPTPNGPRFRVDNMITQLADDNDPKLTLFGLWGGVFENRRLAVERPLPTDDLTARLEW